MIRSRRFLATAVACAAALVLAACSGTNSGTTRAAAGDPVSGGTARVIQITEPRSLDPAVMSNAWPYSAFLGNALYGTLMINDVQSGEIKYKMAESFRTSDSGATFELKLRPGLKFSDGSPLNAEAVKFNWDRIKDPALGSASIPEASVVASTAVVDATTLKVTLRSPVPNYAQAVVSSSMNWIGSPQALQAGRQAFDAKPVGAGPYTLQEWTRQNKIELVKNPGYWDAPRPYLDHITLRTAVDATQRVNTLISGGADVVIDQNATTIAKARDAGFEAQTILLNGGQYFAMNTRKAPFDDVRARKAVAAAIDLGAIDQSLNSGKGQIPRTLFTESSPFFANRELAKTDPATAQRLFDELAAEGKPVSFTFKSVSTKESKSVAESVQAQLSAFRNVQVQVKIVDPTETASLQSTKDFDMLIWAALFVDPEPRMFLGFHGSSPANMSGINDKELNAALEKGRTATTQEERKSAYNVVQERLIELTPAVFYTRATPSAVLGKNVYGAVQYGHASLLPEELWIKK